MEPLLELLLLELLLLPLLDEPLEELPLEELPERDTPEDELPELPELEDRRGALVELPLDDLPEEEPESFEPERRETLSLSDFSRFEVRRSEVDAGAFASVGVSRVRAGRATEVLPVLGKLTVSSVRESDAPRRAERRPSLEEPLPSVRVSRMDSVSVRRVRR